MLLFRVCSTSSTFVIIATAIEWEPGGYLLCVSSMGSSISALRAAFAGWRKHEA